MPCHLLSEKPFPNTLFEALPTKLHVISLGLVTCSFPLFSHSEITHQLSLLLAEKASDFSRSSYVLLSRLFTIFVALLLVLSNSFMSFFRCNPQNLHTELELRPHSAEQRRFLLSPSWQCWVWCTPGYN